MPKTYIYYKLWLQLQVLQNLKNGRIQTLTNAKVLINIILAAIIPGAAVAPAHLYVASNEFRSPGASPVRAAPLVRSRACARKYYLYCMCLAVLTSV